MAALSPSLACLMSWSATALTSPSLTRWSRHVRREATARAKGLPGPPGQPLANRPFWSRPPSGGAVVWGAGLGAAVVAADMAAFLLPGVGRGLQAGRRGRCAMLPNLVRFL